MSWLDWLIVFVLNGSVIAYGFYLARSTKSSSDWFLGGRSLPWWGLGLSIFATSVDNADAVSLTGYAYNHGMHIITAFTLASVCGAILAAFLVVPVLYRGGFYTNAEYLETRYGKSIRTISALIQIQYRTSMLGLMIWSIYLMLQGILDFSPVQIWSLIVLLVIFTAAYTTWGGLTSVVWTDALQSLIMIAGGITIFCAVWSASGGWSATVEKLSQSTDANGQPLINWLHIGQFQDSQSTSPYLIVIGWTIVGLGYYTVNHTQTMRLMGARSLWDMKMAALFGCLLIMPIMIGTALMGVMGRVIVPEFTENSGADQLFPYFANQFLAPGFKGLVVAGILSAAISTFDSIGSALSALFTRDIYARWICTDQTEKHYLKVTRWATIGILLMGFLYIPFIVRYDNMIQAFRTLIPIFVTPLFTIYLLGVLTRVPRKSGLVGLIAGSLFGLFGFIDRELVDLEWLSPLLTEKWYAFPCSMLVTSIAMFAAALKWGWLEKESMLEQNQPEVPLKHDWLSESRQELLAIKTSPFSKPIPQYLNPNWYAILIIALSFWIIFGFFW
ncbi:sodium/solute symporter [uncultured Gimesia sp.]|jgi:solute:Na+ symporter, SSS family|uniref:sodium:solute symporter family transporter n=1 Tax=uncultured Gimesia sp. TaxID=1678688 RepID=UPI00262F914E|nr:sodium/solute symporter [uncultured Gimesia sp.]